MLPPAQALQHIFADGGRSPSH